MHLSGENTLDRYIAKLLPSAYRDLDKIYCYIAADLSSPAVADGLLNRLEEAILSLEKLPYRGSLRRTGAYADKGYRQLFAEGFAIVYRINENKKIITVVAVRYLRSEF